MKKTFLLFIALACITACSLTMPVDIGNAHRVSLPSLSPSVSVKPRNLTLIVSRPRVSDALDTYRMAFRDSDHDIRYFSGMRWADFLPSLVQDSLVSSLAATGVYSNVMSDEYVSLGTQILQIEIKHFEAVYDQKNAPPTWNIDIDFVWRNANNLALIRRQEIRANARAAFDTQEANYAALMNAYHSVLEQLVSRLPQ